MEELKHKQLEHLHGLVMLEFSAEWCGYCHRAQPLIHSALAKYPGVRHIKIEDGRGKRLGRQFGVKLWPSLIFLNDGKEVGRLIRPQDAGIIVHHLADLSRPPTADSQ